MSKKKVIIIVSILLVILVVAGLYGTLASDDTALSGDNIYYITLTGNNNEVVVPAGGSKTVIYQVTNTNKGIVKYGIAYSGTNIDVKLYSDSKDKNTDLIDYGETKFVKLYVENTGGSDSVARIITVLGYENGGELDSVIPSGYSFVTGISDGYSSSTLISHIKNLYSANYDSSYNTSFADGSGMNYYAPSVRLMNDGLDSTGDMVSESDAISGTAGNIRYYGADDSNLKNYIYFNCSDYNNQSDSTCEKWRIIGIVDGKVKILGPYLGEYAYDDVSNDWNNATLKDVLNSETGTYYSSLKTKNSKTIELISETNYYINGMYDYDVYTNTLYKNERTGSNIWPGNIALLYPSDYGYAVDINNCSYTAYYYEYCTDYNWMYNLVTDSGSNYSWLLTPDSDDGDNAWDVFSPGFVSCSYVNHDYGVSPVLYLESELEYDLTTDGSSSNPYKIVLPPENLKEHITKLYVDNYDSSKNIPFADGSGMNYYAPSVRLMNDGLDSTGNMVSAESAANGTAGNIRYYGSESEDLKNYIYFNCSDYNNQSDSTCEKWRIVGIVDGKVKIMSTQTMYSSWGSPSEWNDTSLSLELNDGSYLPSIQAKNTKTLDLISESEWYINRISDNNLCSSDSYKCTIHISFSYIAERTGGNVWKGNVALLYPSDYGFAVDVNKCGETSDVVMSCTSFNWMNNILTHSGASQGLLLNHNTSYDDSPWYVGISGYLNYTDYYESTNGVSPVLYLRTELGIESDGDGSSGNPYRLSVS